MMNAADVFKHPNFQISTLTAQKLLEIITPIKSVLIIANLNNDTVGAILVTAEGKPVVYSEQQKINCLLQVMSTLGIPFKKLQEYGNVPSKMVNMSQKKATKVAKKDDRQ